MKKTIFFLIILFNIFAETKAQVAVSGKVISATDGGILARATITIKGRSNGVITSTDGKFAITIRSLDTLLVSYAGYAPKQINPPISDNITIRLEELSNNLTEVVVSTGYQTLPKERATGSFVKIDNALIERSVSTSIADRLRDVIPGLSFNTYGNSAISIRGQSTIFGNAEPLIVIDNFPYDGNLLDINPNDVESITILKDAAAASIWGARAGNGVIVITSKKGKYNKPVEISFNSNVTVGGKPDLYARGSLSSSDYIEIEKRLFSDGYYNAANLSGYHPLTPVVELLYQKQANPSQSAMIDAKIEALKQQDVRRDFDKYFYQKSINQQYALNLNGGGRDYTYFLSTGYDNNRQSLVGNAYYRVSINAGSNFKLFNDRLSVDANIAFIDNETSNNNSGINGVTSAAVSSGIYPYASLADENGNGLPIIKTYRTSFTTAAQNNGLLNWEYYPLEELASSDNTNNRKNIRLSTALKYKILNGLNASVLYQYNNIAINGRNLRREDSFYARDLINRFTQVSGTTISRPIPLGGILDRSEQQSTNHTFRGQLDFNHNFNQVHELSAIAGYEIRNTRSENHSYRYYGYNDEYATSSIVDYTNTQFPMYYDITRRGQIPNADEIGLYNDRYLSYYANASYTYNAKYTLSGSSRLDQSNLFGVNTNQKGVPLWSAGLSWNISKESFYQLPFIPYLKLRATYGYNGSVNKSVSAFTTATLTGLNLYQQPYATIINPPNPELRWERVKILNTGIDFGLRGNRITGSVEYYYKQGIDLIGDTPFPPSSGILLFRGNTANTNGNGVDIALHTINFNGALKWQSDIAFGYLKEKISKYGVTLQASGSSGYIQYPFALPLEGKPLYGIYSYKWAGLNPQSGDPQGYINGVESTDYTNIFNGTNLDNMIFNGSLRPVTFGSIINTISFKDFSISFNISYRLGYYFRKASIGYGNDFGLSSNSKDYELRWQNPGDEISTSVPSVPLTPNANRDVFYGYSNVLVDYADNIRLQDMRLNYSPKSGLFGKNFKNVNFFIYATNLGIIWKATKFDVDPDNQFGNAPFTMSAGLKLTIR
ncbi:SusC/RagA family TonB-linked outer membrane protein [Pedobacter nototheniae]|uniref:SusC/RagA family TonB-linked outer membrane protein n=1 Tax=Pedobacter nototheniae TaxID=2488994 RepID=UPI00292DEAA7|nr:SusC/RagA family TonB-linked outer membrane protein [Pedobacter nototheniae]